MVAQAPMQSYQGQSVVRRQLIEATCVALESGEYPQDVNFLRTETGWCCLGVLVDQAAKLGLLPGSWRERETTDAQTGQTRIIYEFVGEGFVESEVLPDRLTGLLDLSGDGAKQLPFDSPDQKSWAFRDGREFDALASANDSFVPFPDIAEVMRRDLLGQPAGIVPPVKADSVPLDRDGD